MYICVYIYRYVPKPLADNEISLVVPKSLTIKIPLFKCLRLHVTGMRLYMIHSKLSRGELCARAARLGSLP